MSENELLDELNALVGSHQHLTIESDGQVFYGGGSGGDDPRARHDRALSRAEVQLLAHQLNHLSEGQPGGGVAECTYRGVRWTLLSQPLAPSWTMMACRARRQHVELHALSQKIGLEPTLVAALHDAFASRANILCSSPMRTKLLPFFDALLLFPQPGQLAFVIGDIQELDFGHITARGIDRNHATSQSPASREALLRWLGRSSWVFCDRLDDPDLLAFTFAGSPFSQGRVAMIEAARPAQAVERTDALGEDARCSPTFQRVLHVEGNRVALYAQREHGLELVAESRIRARTGIHARAQAAPEAPAPSPPPRAHAPIERTPSREVAAVRSPSSEMPAHRPQRRPSSSSGVRPAPQQAASSPARGRSGSFKRAGSGLLRRSGEFSSVAQTPPPEEDPLAEVEADFSFGEDENFNAGIDRALAGAVDAAFQDDDDDEITFAEETQEPATGGEGAGGFFFDDDELAELEEAARSASSPGQPQRESQREPRPQANRRSSRYNVEAVRADAQSGEPRRGRGRQPRQRPASQSGVRKPSGRRSSGSFRGAQPQSGSRFPQPRGGRPRIGRNAATKGGSPGAVPAHLQEGTLGDDVTGDILDEPTRRAQVPRSKPKDKP